MSQNQKYVDLLNDLHGALKGMTHNAGEFQKPGITGEQFKEVMDRTERLNNKCAAIYPEMRKLNLSKDVMLELFNKTKFKKEPL
jgi:hypothetical protein